ncbi:MAG: endonuclease/exonuclease/phosphatase family protein [Bacteroidaceae bacterium]
MKTNWCYFFLIALLLLEAPETQARRLKLMTYNIHHAEGMDKKYAPERIAQLIGQEAPDVVALQEVDSATLRVGGRYAASEIAQAIGMHDIYAGAIPFQGGKYGIALLSRRTPKEVKRIGMPGREEKRALLVADFGPYVVCCTHLSLTAEDRILSIPLIRKALRKYRRKPIFIMGDFNAEPDSEFMKQMGKHFQVLSSTITPTFPYNNPREVIDYVITRKGTNQPRAIHSHIVVGNLSSDHCPLMVEVEY